LLNILTIAPYRPVSSAFGIRVVVVISPPVVEAVNMKTPDPGPV
jgi:hypothetical protein